MRNVAKTGCGTVGRAAVSNAGESRVRIQPYAMFIEVGKITFLLLLRRTKVIKRGREWHILKMKHKHESNDFPLPIQVMQTTILKFFRYLREFWI